MKTFKIGLDILADVPGQSGQVNIHRNTLLWLPHLAPKWQFYVFATHRLQTYYESYGVGAPNLQWIKCWADNTDGTLRRIFAQELQLPWLARQVQLDCLIAYPLPFLFPCTKIATVYRHTLSHSVLTGIIGQYRRLKIKYSALFSDGLFCNSHYALAELQDFVGVDLKETAIIAEAFDSTIFCQTPPTILPLIRSEIADICSKSYVRVLVPAGLQPHKNSVIIFEMLSHLQKIDYNLPIVIFVGNNSDEYTASLRNKYPTYFADGTVQVLGFCSHEELAYLGRNAQLVIYPSKIETFGVPPLEMMAVGAPVLLSSAGPLPEISGLGAELFDPDDAEDLAQKVVILLNSSVDRNALAARGAQFVKKYSWERNARETLAFIQSILERKAS